MSWARKRYEPFVRHGDTCVQLDVLQVWRQRVREKTEASPDGKEWGCMLVLMALGATLGVWKLGEFAWWLVTHVKVTW